MTWEHSPNQSVNQSSTEWTVNMQLYVQSISNWEGSLLGTEVIVLGVVTLSGSRRVPQEHLSFPRGTFLVPVVTLGQTVFAQNALCLH